MDDVDDDFKGLIRIFCILLSTKKKTLDYRFSFFFYLFKFEVRSLIVRFKIIKKEKKMKREFYDASFE